MRIVSGQFRGRALVVPDTADTRPTMDRTRQAIFNILRSASWALKKNGEPILKDAIVIDAFAGSGAMGFEALSQGAKSAIFVDNAKLAGEAIQKNINKIALNDRTRLFNSDIAKIPNNAGPVCAVAFLDPPYQMNLIMPTLKALADKKYIDATTVLVLEMHKTEEIMDVTVMDTRLYGTSKVVFAKLDD